MKLETVSCPSCGTAECNSIANPASHSRKITGRFPIVCCNSCGLIYLNPRPDRSWLNECYQLLEEDEADYEHKDNNNHKTLARRFWHKLNHSSPTLLLIDRGPVLDIGCNRGDLLSEVSALGYEAHGLEFSASAVTECTCRGLKVTLGDIQELEIPKDFYKCIVLSHLLEHLSDPVSVLRKLRAALPLDGRLIICVPNCSSPMTKLFGDSWHGWDPPFHLVHFDRNSLTRMCEQAGLCVSTIKIKGHPEDFTRSFDLWLKKPRRRLLLRAVLWPFFLCAGALGQGSYLLVSASPRQS